MNETIAARLYTRGAAEARTVTLAWRGAALEITPDVGTPWLVQAGVLAFEARGFNHTQLAVRWTEQGEHRLLMLDTDAAAALTDSVPGVLRERVDRVRGTRRRTERRFRLGVAALILFVFLPIGGLIAFWFEGDAVVDWAVAHVPSSVEAGIGEVVLAQTRAQHRLITSGPRYDAVQAIARRLVQPGENLRFYVSDAPEVNAYAAPGGVVVVQAGLLQAATDAEQVAGVLAHEIAHVELHHSLKLWVQAAGVRGLALMILGDWEVLVNAGTELAQLKFSRDAESAADLRAVERMRAAQIDPNGLPRFLAFVLRDQTGPELPGWLSTHPVTVQRISAIDHAISAEGINRVRPFEIDWAAVRDPARAATTAGADAQTAANTSAPAASAPTAAPAPTAPTTP